MSHLPRASSKGTSSHRPDIALSIDHRTAVAAARLAADAVVATSEVVETMHARISILQPTPADPVDGRARGITGLVHRCIRGVARAVARFASAREGERGQPLASRGPLVSAMNGVLGDHLERVESPLAERMTLRVGDDAGTASAPREKSGRLLVLVHGLCMNDRQWLQRGHDHGVALARDLDFTAAYIGYNTGLHVSENGRLLSGMLERLAAEWPIPLEEIVLLGHSMGGLVARSAIHHAELADSDWTRVPGRLVCLGSPHEGSPLERAGNLLHRALGASSFTAPITRVAALRSAGITDLRHGSITDEEWHGRDRFGDPAAVRTASPPNTPTLLIAGSLGAGPGDLRDRLLGDLLVPTSSALQRGPDGSAATRWTAYGRGHFDLLSDPEVYRTMRDWLAVPLRP